MTKFTHNHKFCIYEPLHIRILSIEFYSASKTQLKEDYCKFQLTLNLDKSEINFIVFYSFFFVCYVSNSNWKYQWSLRKKFIVEKNHGFVAIFVKLQNSIFDQRSNLSTGTPGQQKILTQDIEWGEWKCYNEFKWKIIIHIILRISPIIFANILLKVFLNRNVRSKCSNDIAWYIFLCFQKKSHNWWQLRTWCFEWIPKQFHIWSMEIAKKYTQFVVTCCYR